MCGRFALLTSGEDLVTQFGVSQIPIDVSMIAPRYNVAPTQPVVVVRETTASTSSADGDSTSSADGDSNQRELTFLQWGLIPSWAKDPKIGSRLINARSETVAEKPSFRAAFKRRRCLILADGFYEWQSQNGKKQPMFIHLADQAPFALAGLWESWYSPDGGVIDTCTILTTTPNELMEPIHNRMPVILEPEDYNTWLIPGDQPNIAMHLLRPFASEKMTAYPVSTWVNSPAHDDAQCITPLQS
jgi:putative SOS response-associated peptidase YedK